MKNSIYQLKKSLDQQTCECCGKNLHPTTDRQIIGSLLQTKDKGPDSIEGDNNHTWLYAIGMYYKPKTIIEIGTHFGYSLKAFISGAGHQPEEFSLWIYDNKCDGVKLDICKNYFNSIGIKNLNINKIDVRLLSTLNMTNQADLVMINADPTEIGCLHECNLAIEALKPGGIIVIDSIIANKAIEKGFNKFLTQNNLEPIELLPSLRGVYLVQKPIDWVMKHPSPNTIINPHAKYNNNDCYVSHIAIKRQIDVFGHMPFNGSAVKIDCGYFLIYRLEEFELASVSLDNALQVIPGTWRKMPLNKNVDPRLLKHENKIYLSTSYSSNNNNERIELRELFIEPNGDVTHKNIGKFDSIDGLQKNKREKNWLMFISEDSFYYLYSVNPHQIIQVDLTTGLAKNIEIEKNNIQLFDGCPTSLGLSAGPVLLKDGRFLAIYHSRPKYYQALYTFESKFPFRLLEAAKIPLLIPNDSPDTHKRSSSGSRGIFITQAEVDEDKNLLRLFGGDMDATVICIDMRLDLALNTLQKYA